MRAGRPTCTGASIDRGGRIPPVLQKSSRRCNSRTDTPGNMSGTYGRCADNARFLLSEEESASARWRQIGSLGSARHEPTGDSQGRASHPAHCSVPSGCVQSPGGKLSTNCVVAHVFTSAVLTIAASAISSSGRPSRLHAKPKTVCATGETTGPILA